MRLRIQVGKFRQEFWSCPNGASHLNWSILLGILVLAEKPVAFKLVNTDRNFGPDRKNASHITWKTPPRIPVLTEDRPAFELVNIARNFSPDGETPGN